LTSTGEKILLIVVLLGLGALNAHGETVLEKLTKSERKQLESGKVVFRSVKSKTPDGELVGSGQAMAYIKAPIDRCWEIFCHFEKSHEYFPHQFYTEVLEFSPTSVLVKKKFFFFIKKINYYVRYDLDPANYRIDYRMEKGRENDIKDTAGYFIFEKVDDNTTLFVFTVTMLETGYAVPYFIEKPLTQRSLPGQVENVRKRIESGGVWKKD